MSVSAHPDECPYCAPPFGQFTDDHVFPHFLGGRATIRVCRTCNSSFGHSFEGESSKQMNQLQVFVSHFGLDLTRNPAVWPSALTVGDSVYNLKTGPTGTQYELANPIIRRDESGKIVGYQPRSRKEGEVIARSLIKKGKAKRVEMNEVPGQAIEGVKLGVNLSFNLSLYRFATKIVANTAVLMGHMSLIRNSGIRNYLHGKGEWSTAIGCCDTSVIRRLRPPLSHTVCIEFGAPSHLIAILFGQLQIYVPLPAAPSRAVLGFLDPITGEESFKDVEPVSLMPPPRFQTAERGKRCIAEMLGWLEKEGKERGAAHPPNLQMVEVDLGAPAFPWWIDGTYKYLKR